MSFCATIDLDRPYLLATLSGGASLALLCAAADFIAGVASRTGGRRVLVDMSGIQADLSFTEHLQLGTHVATRMASLERVATVVRPELRNGTSEKAAQKGGLQLRAFTDAAHAAHLLLD